MEYVKISPRAIFALVKCIYYEYSVLFYMPFAQALVFGLSNVTIVEEET